MIHLPWVSKVLGLQARATMPSLHSYFYPEQLQYGNSSFSLMTITDGHILKPFLKLRLLIMIAGKCTSGVTHVRANKQLIENMVKYLQNVYSKKDSIYNPFMKKLHWDF